MARSPVKRRVTPEERASFRQELIDIARRIFLEEGYGAVTIRRITSAAGVTPMAFYWYFDCKDALLTVIWDELVRESADVCQAAAVEESEPQARVLRYFTAFIDFWLARRDRFRFIFMNDTHTAAFVQLRRALFTMNGVKQHFQQYDALLAPLFADRPDAAEAIEQLRTLSMYRAFGFLYCAVCIYDHTPEDTVAPRALALEDVRRTLAQWCTPSGIERAMSER